MKQLKTVYKNRRFCFYCELEITDSAFITKDHVIPKSLGGSVTVDCCIGCNAMKRNYKLPVFRENIAYLAFHNPDDERLHTILRNLDNLMAEIKSAIYK